MTRPTDLEELTEEDYRAIVKRLKDNLARHRKARGEPTDNIPDGKEVLPTGG